MGSVTSALSDLTGGFTDQGIGRLLTAAVTGGISEVDRALEVEMPDTPVAPITEAKTGQVAGEGGGKTFSEEESDARKKAVRKKRLGTKALQIPLSNTTATGVATAANTGIKV